MLSVHFNGWFQCRLATNPDPSDEPRGVSGYTFAMPGEPDLDRIIRFQHPRSPRSHGPSVGVGVDAVFDDDSPMPDHPLLHARVELLEAPRFESRNLLLTDDESGIGLVFPFHLQFSRNGLVLRRKDVIYPAQPDLPLHLVPPDIFRRRSATILAGMQRDPLRIAEMTGIADALAFRKNRRTTLEQDLAVTSDPVTKSALKKRIRELSIEAPMDMRVLSMSLIQSWQFGINGPVEVIHPGGGPSDKYDDPAPWPLFFWMGAWDADALCGFMKGMIQIPSEIVRVSPPNFDQAT